MRTLSGILLLALIGTAALGTPAAAAAPGPATTLGGWQWPVDPVRIVEPYRAPAHDYAPGHRGIDLEVSAGAAVMAPAAGVVAFAGTVAGRPLVTVDHGDGFVTTLEPVTPSVPVGAVIRRGDPVGTASTGGHTPPGAVHFGVREDGEYINPMTLVGTVPRAVLLPCC